MCAGFDQADEGVGAVGSQLEEPNLALDNNSHRGIAITTAVDTVATFVSPALALTCEPSSGFFRKQVEQHFFCDDCHA